MSRNLGQVYFAHNKQGQFLGPNQEGGGDYSAMTAHLIDKEIRQIIDEQYDRALNILNSNRKVLAQTAETLLENEVIEGDDLQVLADNISRKSDSDDGSGVIPEHQPLAA